MAGFEKAKPELDALGIKVVAASVDPGPIGRMEPADVVRLVNFYDRQAAK